ncbi:MCE family protein [Amycolatopsis sp. TRM77291]|uniref:Phospholipid/cholesterol/gamma-HCH transport system substrate-binding protein n=1 Tax=Amycolatopsis roodepoortensis TaxID=700274 RepID=A0ABR9L0M6_9PSEU|nr:MlaD family protein [Amycolatopsis roodepoortensis]MBE1574156.1 phospholipid/cholesterol/gamma-HCH transport system substrate-binding protein [Amycolatopsis roodepoortensis]RSN16817.1 MCE family protein [Streptomyces sp. WAC 05977]
MRGIAGPAFKGLVFFVVTVVATGILAITIANSGVGTTVGYTARFTDATSVNPGDEVRMSGVRIGQVDSVGVVERRLADVRFSIENKRRLTAGATVTIRYRNLVGQRYLSIDPGPDGPAVLDEGALIPPERTQPALDLTALFNGFKPLFQALSPSDVNQLSFEIVQVLQGEGSTIDSLLEHTASLTNTLAGKDEVIGQVVGNLNTVLDTLNSQGDQFDKLVDVTAQLVSGLAGDAKPIGQAIGGLGELTTATADLLQDGRAPLKDSINTLGDLSKNLADNTPVFEQFLANLPKKLDRIGSMVSYGSWFNFYLCSVKSDAPPAPGGPPVGIPLTQGRCR